MKTKVIATAISAFLAICSSVAIGYDIDLGPLGHACDTCGGGVVGGLPVIGHTLTEAEAQTAGPVLEQWINASRSTAINSTMPIPDGIRHQLTGYASEDSMNRARYKIGDNGFVNLANVLEKGGFASAVTLNDVIVFLGPSEANDPEIWAHELTHVDQYSSWGVHDFAIRYVRDFNGVEDPAYAKGNGWRAWYAQQQIVQPPLQIPQQIGAPSGWPSGFETAQCGCWGATTGGNPDGRCQSGMVVAVACAGICPYGGSPYDWVCQ